MSTMSRFQMSRFSHRVSLRVFAVFVLAILCTLPCLALDITGVVDGADGEPLARVLVKLQTKGGRTVRFVQTKGDGKYTLSVPDSLTREGSVCFDKAGYTRIVRSVAQLVSRPDVSMTPEGKQLEEIVVMPSPIRARGDTVVYSVDAMRHASDRTIEDVIKHLPGLSVDASGSIYYNGETINKFYVEGLDMLGGRYTLASRNIKAGDVASVSVYENHQPVKALEKIEHSDRAALNLSLKKKSMLRPTGYAEGGGGLAHEGTPWRGELFSMLISPAMQTYITAKATNFGAGYSFDNLLRNSQFLSATSPFDNLYALSPAGGVKGLPGSRYTRITSQSYTVSTGLKPASDDILRLNLGYGQERSSRSGSASTVYSVGPDSAPVEIAQDASESRRQHNLNADIAYEHNGPALYIGESLSFTGSFTRGKSAITSVPPPDVRQSLRSRSLSVANRFVTVVRRGKSTWQLTGLITYRAVPDNTLTARDMTDGSPIVVQQAASDILATSHQTSFSFGAGARHIFGVDLKLSTLHSWLDAYNVEGESTERRGLNMERGGSVALDAGPFWQLSTGKTVLRVEVPVRVSHLSLRGLDTDRFDRGRYGLNRADVGFSTRLNHRFSPGLRLIATVGRHESSGGIENFILAPIYSSYRLSSVRGSGHIAHVASWSGNLTLDYRDVMAGFFGTFKFMGRRSSTDRMASSTVTPGAEEVAFLNRRNRTTLLQGDLDLSKLVGRSTFRFSARNIRFYGRTIRNGAEYPNSSSSWVASLGASLEFIPRRLMADPSVEFSTDRSDMGLPGEKAVATYGWKASAPLAFYPLKGFEVKVQPRFTADRLYGAGWFSTFFLDASALWTSGKWQLEARLDNLTDRREACVTVVSGMTVRTDRASLRGLETLLTLRYSF